MYTRIYTGGASKRTVFEFDIFVLSLKIFVLEHLKYIFVDI